LKKNWLAPAEKGAAISGVLAEDAGRFKPGAFM
jgi:hypothetical protein